MLYSPDTAISGLWYEAARVKGHVTLPWRRVRPSIVRTSAYAATVSDPVKLPATHPRPRPTPRLSRRVEAQYTIRCRLCRCFVVNQETLPYVQHSDSSSSDDDLVLLYSVAQRDHWVHPINKKRRMFGEYHHLMHDLEADDEKFRTYFRLNKEQFDEVLDLIDQDIKKEDTTFRESITSRERLAICLR
ncbi:hypothetical protein J6590_095672 [Homalodisca vitripennis]|nr:hypothetical protein J6590_095672 [Homalodisca vitripennis]